MAGITLIAKPDKDVTRQENYSPVSLANVGAKSSTDISKSDPRKYRKNPNHGKCDPPQAGRASAASKQANVKAGNRLSRKEKRQFSGARVIFPTTGPRATRRPHAQK